MPISRVQDGQHGSRSSETQLGASPCWVLCSRRSTLYWILQCTGSQWRSLRTGVMWSLTPMWVTTRAAMFWTFCSLVTASLAIPVSRPLLRSSHDVTKEWTILSQESLCRNLLILPTFLIWYSADWHTVFTWGTMVTLVSNTTPRSLTDVTGAMSESPTITPDSQIFFRCWCELMRSTSVLLSCSCH